MRRCGRRPQLSPVAVGFVGSSCLAPGTVTVPSPSLIRPLRHDHYGYVFGHGPQWQEQLQVCGGSRAAETQKAVGLGVRGKTCPDRLQSGARARCWAGAPAGPGLWMCGFSWSLPGGLVGNEGRTHPDGLRGHPGAAPCLGEGGAGAAETRPGRSVRPRRRTKKGGDSPPRRAATARGRGAPRPSTRLPSPHRRGPRAPRPRGAAAGWVG